MSISFCPHIFLIPQVHFFYYINYIYVYSNFYILIFVHILANNNNKIGMGNCSSIWFHCSKYFYPFYRVPPIIPRIIYVILSSLPCLNLLLTIIYVFLADSRQYKHYIVICYVSFGSIFFILLSQSRCLVNLFPSYFNAL